jgi:predicted nuclease of predicted toxin-antitoxin system
MNLSPDWREILRAQGHDVIHWSETGKPKAPDREVMAYAAEGGYVVFTHDLGFSAMLAATQSRAPSIIQVRSQDTLSAHFRDLVFASLQRFQLELTSGAIVVIEESRARVRILPLAGREP